MAEGSSCVSLMVKIIAEEFIKIKAYGVCLPATIILHEECKKLGITLNMMCGSMTSGNPRIPLHFWCEHEGTVYDPTKNIIESYMGNVPEFVYAPNQQLLGTPEAKFMFELYEDYRKSECSHKYFQIAPEYLRRVRKSIQKHLKKSVKNKKN